MARTLFSHTPQVGSKPALILAKGLVPLFVFFNPVTDISSELEVM